MSKSRAKGTAAETAVVKYLNENGFPYAERRALQGVNDRGDVAGIPGVVLEVKNAKRIDLAGWIKELEIEMSNAGASVGALVIKRVGKTDPGEWYAVMKFNNFVKDVL